jgi:pimeloyl-ACP methyl ester carboxylesterase
VQPPAGVVRHITASDNNVALLRAGRDPHMIWTTRFDTLYGLVNLMQDAADRSANLQGNVLFLYGAHDQIIPRASALACARRLPEHVRTAYYENGYHWLLRDLQAEVVYADILAYLNDAAAPLPSESPPLLVRAVQANR